MPHTHKRWMLNEAEVAAKVIDDEAIILNLSTGLYYSLSGVGTDVWTMLTAQMSADEIVGRLAGAYGESPGRITHDLEQLIAQLEEERLIVVSGNGHDTVGSTPVEPLTAAGYSTPSLAKHTDMAELLALDPPMPGLMDRGWSDSLG